MSQSSNHDSPFCSWSRDIKQSVVNKLYPYFVYLTDLDKTRYRTLVQ